MRQRVRNEARRICSHGLYSQLPGAKIIAYRCISNDEYYYTLQFACQVYELPVIDFAIKSLRVTYIAYVYNTCMLYVL